MAGVVFISKESVHANGKFDDVGVTFASLLLQPAKLIVRGLADVHAQASIWNLLGLIGLGHDVPFVDNKKCDNLPYLH